ncbi:Mediator complex, subunit Med1 [Ophiocordyceps camponoti-floridani]|uniref:Mediator of RNA polymerase II transcription subunit 1 n=1 Tax=Ophiocordyceps camponoti-floridani TaxID=2030778 RepID=A0A8H4VBV8_9HYPO|nr:Mediator complex, subunit Med1 [Ophiocordyceps camponoti-floridani]
MTGPQALSAFNFDSPSTAAAMGALGIGGSFDMGLENVAALDGLGSALAGEDDKLKRLDAILKILAEKRGLVSEASLERLAQRIGLELLSEEQTTPGGRKTRTLAIAGSAMALDIVLDNNIVQTVSLSYHGNAPSVSRHMEAAGRILLRDLQLRPDQSPLTKSLASFASNFERLAVLDKLSIVPGLDCHEALAGIYDSLERLHRWDLSKLREEPAMTGKTDAELAMMAMCSRHGVPVMHARRKVGLALQYWKALRLSPQPSINTEDEDDDEDKDDDDDSIWSLLIGCAPIQGLGLPPVRVSDNWISRDVIKPVDSHGLVLDWLEPDNVSLPQSDDNKDAAMDLLQPDLSTTRVPRVMFTLTLAPPVILPQNDWSRLYMMASVNPPEMELLGPRAPRPTTPSSSPSPPARDSIPANHPISLEQKNTLFVYKPIYSQAVSEIPFSHPRQKQLRRPRALLTHALTLTSPSPPPTESRPPTTKTTRAQLESFLTGPPETSTATGLEVILWMHPSPHLQVVFPLADATADVTLKILQGGAVEVVEENVLRTGEASSSSSSGKAVDKGHLARALEYLEDLSKWAEWIRTRVRSGDERC